VQYRHSPGAALSILLVALPAGTASCSGYKANDLPPQEDAGGDDAALAGDAGTEGGLDGAALGGDAGTEGGLDAADASPPDGAPSEAGPLTDIYVDVNAGTAQGTGAPDAPLRTITQGLAIATRGATIHAAGGTYDAAAGEIFPLVLRGVSLVGAASSQPTIVGSGFYPIVKNPGGGGQVNNQYPTLVLGDDLADTRVAGVALLPKPGIANASADAILCDRGTAPTGGASKTRVEKVAIGSGYTGFGIFVFGRVDPAASPSGCNLVLVGSAISVGPSSTGVFIEGFYGNAPASVALGGPNQGDGNTFSGTGAGSFGINFSDFAAGTNVVQGNTFDGGDYGLWTSREGMKVVVRNNTFTRLVHGAFVGYSVVDELSGNRFIKNTAAGDPGATSFALGLGGNGGTPDHYGQILSARGNTFLGNDLGVYFRADTQGTVTSRASNFGDATIGGGNVFRCNGTAVRADATFGAALSFVGNGWDRKPPNVATGGTEPANTDVFCSTAGWPCVAADQPYQATDACP
jgi:hypothetical protein